MKIYDQLERINYMIVANCKTAKQTYGKQLKISWNQKILTKSMDDILLGVISKKVQYIKI